MERLHAQRKSVLFNNLVLLGFKPQRYQKKYNIPFNKDMFDVPNKKAFEIVTLFLFTKLSAVTGKDYDMPWPLLNKELERKFQKTCSLHLMYFSQENEVRFPRIVPSVIFTCGGVRFVEIYFAFSSYILKKGIKNKENVYLFPRPTVTEKNFRTVSETVKLATIASKNRFVDTETVTYRHDVIWRKYTENLSECLQKLKQLEKSNAELLRIKTALCKKYYFTDPNENATLEKLFENCLKKLEVVNKEREILEQFFSSEENLFEQVASEIVEGCDRDVLKGEDINIDLVHNIPEKINSELKEIGSCCEKDGKISVIRILKVLKVYVKFLTEVVRKTSTKDICELDLSGLNTEQLLVAVNNFNKNLSEKRIPELEEEISELESKFLIDEEESVFDSAYLSQLDSLCNVSYTPEAVKKRVMDTFPDIEENLRLYSSASTSSDPGEFDAANASEASISDSAKEFKMNDSWLKEESLDDVTFPDVIDDCYPSCSSTNT